MADATDLKSVPAKSGVWVRIPSSAILLRDRIYKIKPNEENLDHPDPFNSDLVDSVKSKRTGLQSLARDTMYRISPIKENLGRITEFNSVKFC